ncbi:MAG: phosphoribosylaminoimidazolesuccinocarboxamide synthase, partial [Actinobacteria bacterium]|nr:phosphoribosylaminoimidazolesuccinocarboxamide synthase [Actinomycetota bacterium]
ILPQPIPDKGKVLTALSHYWFLATEHVCQNHLLSVTASDLPDLPVNDLRGRAMLCRRAKPFAVEFVVRGYLSGSGWRDYRATGEVCGHRLAEGLVESDALPEPIVTPATKATSGHDENITEAQAAELVGPHYETARDMALALYRFAVEAVRDRGVVIADTKFEFGLADGEVLLIDEALTPDSSRFWPENVYVPGGPQPSFDKQFVRDWLDESGWDHTPPAPDLPPDVVTATRTRYIEAYERITERPFTRWMELVSA